MKIRDGFVTNSSSTNYIIISKKELTHDYLYKKLGFSKSSKILSLGSDLTTDLLSGTESGVRWFDVEKIDYDTVLEIFGEETAKKYKELTQKGFYTYLGHINSDDSCLTSFMTTDRFEIVDKDFYMNGLNCGW